MNNSVEKSLGEIVFKYYEYYPGDEKEEHYQVLVAFLPTDMMEAYQNHQSESDDLGIAYLNKQLKEYGLDDDDIFFYFEESDYRKAIIDHPHGGDVLVEVENGM